MKYVEIVILTSAFILTIYVLKLYFDLGRAIRNHDDLVRKMKGEGEGEVPIEKEER